MPKQNLNTPTPSAQTIRANIAGLRAQYGDCLNLWPAHAQRAHTRLARQLRQIEAIRVDHNTTQFQTSPESRETNAPQHRCTKIAKNAGNQPEMAAESQISGVRDV